MNRPTPSFARLADLEAFLHQMALLPSDEEGLTELKHALQCADVLHGWAPDDVELQVAGLVHDIGSALGHPEDHGQIGAEAIRGLLGERVAELVRLHVDAKRYLVTIDADYFAKLSPTSVRTLQLQGGPMQVGEARAFGANPFCNDALRLRQADDLAKTVGAKSRTLVDWLPSIRQVCG